MYCSGIAISVSSQCYQYAAGTGAFIMGPFKNYHIQKQADFLLDNMGFFFVPPTVAILGYLGYMQGKIAIVLFICFITVITTFAVTSWTVTAMMKYEIRRKERKRHAESE